MSLRWQDLTNIILGFLLIISPQEMGYELNHAAAANAYSLGAGLIVFNLIAAFRLVDMGDEIVNILLGLWLTFSPYLLGFSADMIPRVIALVIGGLVIFLAVTQIFIASTSREK